MKKRSKILLICIPIMVVLAYILTIISPYFGYRNISQNTIDNFNNHNFCSDSPSGEKVIMLDDGAKALDYRLSLINKAQKQILLCSYDFYLDNTGSMVFSALVNRADNGVKVKLFLDGKTFSGKKEYISLACAHPNMEIYLFNPFNVLKPHLANMAMHDKYLVCDDFAYILGGRNVGDKYYSYPELKGRYSLDREVMVISHGGASINQVKDYFNQGINCKYTKHYTKSKVSDKKLNKLKNQLSDIYNNISFKSIDFDNEGIGVNKITLVHNPFEHINKEPVLAYTLYNLAKQQGNAIIQTPYTTLTPKHKKMLLSLTENDSVKMLTNSIGTSPNFLGYSCYYNERKSYVKGGLDIYEFQSDTQSIHAKSMFFGDSIVCIGSFNLDERSIRINTESMLIIHSKEFYDYCMEVMNGYFNKAIKVNDQNKYDESNVTACKTTIFKKFFFRTMGVILYPIKILL